MFGYWIRWDTKSWKIKHSQEALTERLTERITDEIYVYPFAENIILNISNTIPPQIVNLLKIWLQKPTWISTSNETFSLIKELDKTVVDELKGKIEQLFNSNDLS